jgi:hypothetical protein
MLRRTSAGGLLLLVLGACDLGTGPAMRSATPAAAPLSPRHAESVLLGTYSVPTSMPVPGQTTSAQPPRLTTLPVQPNTYVLFRIGGTLEAVRNPYLVGTKPGEGAISYTAVESSQATLRGSTSLWLRPSTSAAPPSGGEKLSYYFRPDAGGQDLVLLVRIGAVPPEVWAERDRLPGAALPGWYCYEPYPYCGNNSTEFALPGNNGGAMKWIEEYWLTQSHTISATAIAEPLGVEGPEAVSPGATATFTARPWGDLRWRDKVGNPADVLWVWYPGDTTGTPPPNVKPEIICAGQQPRGTCNAKLTGSGRLHIVSHVEGALVKVDRIVRVKDANPVLTVRCTPSPVARGADVSCSAKVAPALDMTILEWRASGQGFDIIKPVSTAVAANDSAVWAGTAVASARVTVRARITQSGKVVRGAGTFAVTPRVWDTYQITAPPKAKREIRGRMVNDLSNGVYGNFSPTGLNPFSTTVDSVAAGPNAGLMYFVDRPPFIFPGATVAVHPALYPPQLGKGWGNPAWERWYNDQNGRPSGTCTQAEVPLLRSEVERHEGLTLAPDSHVGVFNRASLQYRPDRDLEALYLFQLPRDQLYTRAYTVYRAFILGNQSNMQNQFDPADYQVIANKFACKFDLNPIDQ